MIVINISKKSHYSTKKYCGLIDYQSHSAYIYLIIFPHPVKSNLFNQSLFKHHTAYHLFMQIFNLFQLLLCFAIQGYSFLLHQQHPVTF